jgi:hypothetical protein
MLGGEMDAFLDNNFFLLTNHKEESHLHATVKEEARIFAVVLLGSFPPLSSPETPSCDSHSLSTLL